MLLLLWLKVSTVQKTDIFNFPAFKQIENPWPVGAFPLAFTARQHNEPRQVQYPGEAVRPQDQKSAAIVIAKEVL